ncbi:methylamine utilization protein [Paraglaciecola hydrolytica]|uniref:Methylamine utilization protein n=1 Tax=Paraglaciecola hydrolytica TaxID=1799789 RepID=A0A135ZYP3_9ALTE|nr:methylamine utilization protein [Paraglaciecola hydrolytica]KXI28103.1 hypothetical protein AX660_17100 [Paraglaciecola hydrolytica]
MNLDNTVLLAAWQNVLSNKLFSTAKKLLFCGLLLTLGYPLQAKTLKLIDQNNQPIMDAVIAIPQIASADKANKEIAVMDQINKQFLPRVLTITAGQLVAFPNSDDIRHHVYSFSATKPFEIKLFKGVVNAPLMFDKPGIVVLGCNIHDQMVGYIYVAQDEKTFISDAQGEVQLPDSASLVNVWHANLSTQNTKRESVDISSLPASAEGGFIQLNLNLVGQTAVTDEAPKTTSKFKSKFN